MVTYCCVATGDIHHQLLEDCPIIVVALEDKGEEFPHEWEGGDVTEEGGEVEGGEQHGLGTLLGRRRVGREGGKKRVGGTPVHEEQYILEQLGTYIRTLYYYYIMTYFSAPVLTHTRASLPHSALCMYVCKIIHMYTHMYVCL